MESVDFETTSGCTARGRSMAEFNGSGIRQNSVADKKQGILANSTTVNRSAPNSEAGHCKLSALTGF